MFLILDLAQHTNLIEWLICSVVLRHYGFGFGVFGKLFWNCYHGHNILRLDHFVELNNIRLTLHCSLVRDSSTKDYLLSLTMGWST